MERLFVTVRLLTKGEESLMASPPPKWPEVLLAKSELVILQELS